MSVPSSLATAPVAPPRVGHTLAAVALALLLGLQPVTTDVYLPAFPLLSRELAAPMTAAQLTMSALLLAFGLAQLVWGPVADRVGRRAVLLWGLSLYTLASIGCALAGSIEALIVWRIVQGACLAAAVVVARAMVRDLYEPSEGARVMALALTGLGVIALFSPLLGGAVAAWLGWRAALALVALCGAAALVFVATTLPETLLQKNPAATRPGPLLAAWKTIALHPVFQAWALLITCTYGGLFVTLAGSSFVFLGVVGFTPLQFGVALGSCSLAYMTGTAFCRRWVARHGMLGAVRRGALFTGAGGALIVLLALAEVRQAWALLLPMWLYAFGHGNHQPCGQAAVVGPFPRHAGAAAALAGFMLAAVAFLIGLWLGTQPLSASTWPLASGIGFWAACTCAVAGWLLPRALRTPH